MGDHVYYTIKGETIIRAKPLHPKNPKTDAQMAIRESFKLIGKVYKSFKEVVDIGFQNRSKAFNPFNAFMTANFSTAINKSGLAPVIDYSKLIVSSGKLPNVTVKSAEADDAGIRIIYHTELMIPQVSANDQIVALAKLKSGELILTKKIRGREELAEIFIPLQGINPEEVECCYLFALNWDGSNASISTYFEVI